MKKFRSIGTDTEVFAIDATGTFRSLCGLIGGSKEEPFQLPNVTQGFCVQEDNVSCEWNVPPCDDPETFKAYVDFMMTDVTKRLTKLGFTISPAASASFPKQELLHPNALVFGCEPDYNIWTMQENPKPKAEDENLRTAGGHVHVGTDIDMVTAGRHLDLYLGVPSILLDDSEPSRKRRELYGKSGAMRPKPYGLEYRTLSNFWVFKPELIEWVFNATKAAMYHSKKISNKDSNLIQQAINEGDKNVATTLIKNYGLALPRGF